MNQTEPGWELYRTFLAVLQEGSLSGAARALDLTQPTIARHIDALEQALGIQLFVRSQRGLAATEVALDLKPYAEALASSAAAMLRAASGQRGSVSGSVRVTASEIIGAEVLPPILASLRVRHPALEFELVLSNTVDNLLRRDADIAVRMVEPVQEALVVRHVGDVSLGLYAHRSYLERHAEPRRITDLQQHSLIGYDRETPALRTLRQQLPGFDRVRFAFRSDSDLAQFAAIKAGFGIGVCQIAIARRDPDLIKVLTVLTGDFQFRFGTWVVMHEDLRSLPRCRAAFDGLVAGLMEHVDG
jgi:DNA-binding transcriptional LysR family regulator